jgi:hypothetical protein
MLPRQAPRRVGVEEVVGKVRRLRGEELELRRRERYGCQHASTHTSCKRNARSPAGPPTARTLAHRRQDRGEPRGDVHAVLLQVKQTVRGQHLRKHQRRSSPCVRATAEAAALTSSRSPMLGSAAVGNAASHACMRNERRGEMDCARYAPWRPRRAGQRADATARAANCSARHAVSSSSATLRSGCSHLFWARASKASEPHDSASCCSASIAALM